MERFLEENLEEIAWPRETVVAFDINDGSKLVRHVLDFRQINVERDILAAIVDIEGDDSFAWPSNVFEIFFKEALHSSVVLVVERLGSSLPLCNLDIKVRLLRLPIREGAIKVGFGGAIRILNLLATSRQQPVKQAGQFGNRGRRPGFLGRPRRRTSGVLLGSGVS